MDSRVQKHADLLTQYSLKLTEGETVLIRGDIATAPLVRACYASALKLGAHPKVIYLDAGLDRIRFYDASDEQLQYVHDMDRTIIESMDALLSIVGTHNTRTLAQVPPAKITTAARGSSELMQRFHERVASGALRWVGTMHPASGNAQEAGMSNQAFADFVYAACQLDARSPVAAWRRISREQARICKALGSRRDFRILSDGTDLSFSAEDRKWINCCGQNNMPDGEVFTGPVEDSVNGRIQFSFPGISNGREVEDIRLTFKDGKVIDATAAKGEDLLHQMLETDPGARYVGEIAIGTNYQIRHFVKHMLFDEKIGGTVHLAIGRSLPESGGVNESVVHWDMLCDMRSQGRILADGETIYERGRFVL